MSHSLSKTIHLPLHGALDFSGPEHRLSWQCFQAEPWIRLRDISLSSTPARFMPHGMPASRFQHTVGVMHLVEGLARRYPQVFPAQRRLTLIMGAATHDLGSAPFSHICEPFQWELTRLTHEQHVAQILREGEVSELFREHGVQPDEVAALVAGEAPPGWPEELGGLIASSLDGDNAENTLALLLSNGFSGRLPYSPRRLMKAFLINEQGEVSLDCARLEQVLGWQRARAELYSRLRSPVQLSTNTMLHRALESHHQAGALDPAFLRLGESDALRALQDSPHPGARELVRDLLAWRQFPCCFRRSGEEDPRWASLYDQVDARREAADQLAESLGVPAQHLCLYTGRDRGVKAVHWRWQGESAEVVARLFAPQPPVQTLAVFAHKRYELEEDRVSHALRELREELLSQPTPGHTFF